MTWRVTMSSRSWSWLVALSMSALFAVIVVTLLVVDPAQTVTSDLGSLYKVLGVGGWLSIAVWIVTCAAGAAALAALAMLLGHLTWRDWAATSAGLVWAGRISSASAALGLVAAVSIVIPGFPLGLMFFNIAENLGTAPDSGSLSSLKTGIFFLGLSLLAVAGVTGLVFTVLVFRLTRWAHRRVRDAA